MERKNTLILAVFVIAFALVAGGFFYYRGKLGKPASESPKRVENKAQEINGRKYYSQIEIESRAFFFAPDVFEVKAGEKVTVMVRSFGNHIFVIDELGINAKTPDGQVTKIEFTPKEKGVYRYYCSLLGHREAGQVGTLVVQ